MEIWFRALSGAILLYFGFWGCIALSKQLKLLPIAPIAGGYLIYWAANCVIFALALALGHLIQLIWLVPALFAVYRIKDTYREPLFWIGIPLILLVGIVPICDADSVGYMLPQADNAITYGTLGTWPTFNFRSIARFWGVACQAGNQLIISERSIHFIELSSVLTWMVGLSSVYSFLRQLQLRGSFAVAGAATLLLAPLYFTSVFTLKDDLAFGLFFVVLVSMVLSHTRSFVTWGLLWFALISSKLFFPIAALAAIPLILRYRKNWKGASIGFGLAAIGILVFNGPRMLTGLQMAQGRIKPTIGVLLGAAVTEIEPPNLSKASLVVRATTAVTGGAEPTSWMDWGYIIGYKSVLSPLTLVPSALGMSAPSGSFSYNYADLGWSVFLVLLGISCPLLVRTTILQTMPASRQRRVITVAAVALTFFGLMMLVLRVPHYNNYRYLFGPLLLLGIVGIVIAKRWIVWCALASLITFYIALARLPPITTPVKFMLKNKEPAFALSVPALNPALLLNNPKNKSFRRNFGETVVVAPLYPGFSVQYLIFDQSSGPIIETLPMAEQVLSVKDASYIVFSSNWQVNSNPITEGAFNYVLPAGYQKLGSLLDGQVLIFAK